MLKLLRLLILQLLIVGLAAPAYGDSPLIWGPRGALLLNQQDITAADGSIYPKSVEKNYLSGWASLSTWYTSASSSTTFAQDTTAADLPRATTTGIGLKITAVNTKTDYVYTTFKFDASDGGKVLKVQWDQNPLSGYVASDLVVEVDACTVAWTVAANTAATCGGTSSTLALSTTNGNLPAASGTYVTTFTTPAFATAPYILIKISQVSSASHSLVISDVIVGPGKTQQGYGGTAWQTVAQYTMFTNAAIVSPTYNSLVMRHEGDSLHMRGVWGGGTATVGTSAGVTFNLPAGYTINTAALASTAVRDGIGTAWWQTSAPVFTALNPEYGSSTTLIFAQQGGSQLNQNQLATGAVFQFEFTIPVNELAGSGTVNIAQNDLQYYFSTGNTWGTTNSSATTSQGPGGVAGGSTTPTGGGFSYTFTPSTPLPVGSKAVLEISPDQLHWSLAGAMTGSSNSPMGTLVYDGTNYVGGGAGVTTSGQIIVQFGKYANGGSYAWSNLGTWYWRVTVGLPGQAIGFSTVSSTSSGLAQNTSLLSYIHMGTQNGNGSTNTTVRRFTTTISSNGSDITYADSATAGATFTINTGGIYSVSFCDSEGSGGNLGATINNNSPSTTNIAAVSASLVLFTMSNSANDIFVCGSVTRFFNAADVIRAQTDGGTATSSVARTHFDIQRIL